MALNGRFPDTMLAYLGWPEMDHLRLVPAAAASITRLAAAFEAEFGRPLYLSDAYRTYAQQVALKITKGVFAATPGTSNHGLGLAIDVASRVNVDGSAEHRWFEANAPLYGWVNPVWAVDFNPYNGQHEPWHWEYRPALDTHPTFAPEDDMPLDQSDIDRIKTQAVFPAVYNLLKEPEILGVLAKAVWAHKVAGSDGIGVDAYVWLRDTRVIVGKLTAPGAIAAISDADLARVAQACANEADRRAFARLSD